MWFNILYDIVHINSVIEAEGKWYFEPSKDTPYLTLMNELLGVFYVEFGLNWPSYNGTPLYRVLLYIT